MCSSSTGGSGPGGIAGRVLDASGAPVRGAVVSIAEGPGPHLDIAAVTADDGRFRFTSLPPGLHRLAVRGAEGLVHADATVEPGFETELEVRIDA